ncbi:ABC transporter permease [Candidatus Viridilinea mediisalina]|uniref:ABC transporter permease n=1 Tax=Candidatus Viridilinea mediisalina TaxID=2024553 RepID=A0A2A6RFK9_9CHLR|nr:ABC-2 family transporter protein [Candidatus Viridilinea mediisalina]PDW01857.1 ABC transporter permease [Candidatus Viridilinea mediisalina]
MFDLYWTTARTAVMVQLQYRMANYFYMIGMIAEPIIYLVVWSTIAAAQGGEVGGYTPGAFAAYYIVWTLVRNMNIVFTPYGWEWRIKHGELSAALLRPVHPLHFDIAYFAGWKFVVILLWLPLAGLLALLFPPTLHPTWLEVVVFCVAIWGAYLIRTMFLWLLGMVTFWTTRVSALYELYFACELLLSGRLVPMALLPAWARELAWFLPFQWTFGFPIEALVGQLTPHELLLGLAMQLLWILVGLGLVQLVWRAGVRRYGAVGG